MHRLKVTNPSCAEMTIVSPGNGTVTVAIPDKSMSTIRILQPDGRCVKTERIGRSPVVTVKKTDLGKGVYVVNAVGENVSYTRTLIVE